MTFNYNIDHFQERTECPVCNSSEFDVLYANSMTRNPVLSYLESQYRNQGDFDQDYLTGTDYVACECSKCGLMFQKMVPDGDLMGAIYNQFIQHEKTLARAKKSLSAERFIYRTNELVSLTTLCDKQLCDIKLLDFGFGYAGWARIASALGCEVYGVEISPKKKEYAAGLGVINISEEDAFNMKFDIVHTEQVLEHVGNPKQLFANLAKTLTPGGLFKVAVPAPAKTRQTLAAGQFPAQSEFDAGGESDIAPLMPLEHLNCFTTQSINRLAREAGLSPTHLPSVRLVDFGTRLNPIRMTKELMRPFYRRYGTDRGYYLFRCDS